MYKTWDAGWLNFAISNNTGTAGSRCDYFRGWYHSDDWHPGAIGWLYFCTAAGNYHTVVSDVLTGTPLFGQAYYYSDDYVGLMH